ncbi:MAG: polyribonucleotide nucleotidyltransferase, partial [Bacteroidales bacterium]|nr:polyribonucleotide nucleotidyltransferase [Bacteroidales bacterium]
MNVVTKSITLGDGRTISIETGKLAKQADGAVMVTMGKTMLLATVCSATEVRPGTDFMPLSVDYKEKFAANGKFPGGFLRREGRPSDAEILVSRLIDRALRPLFPDDYHADTFVNVTLFSSDGEDMPDALAGLAASACLSVSDIPFNGPISECRVARVNGEFVVNPTFEKLAQADMEFIVAATIENIMMVEGEMKEVSEDDLLEAMKIAHEEIKKQCQVQLELMEAVGKTVKREYCHEDKDEDLKKDIWAKTYDKVYVVASSCNANKHERAANFKAVKTEYIESLDPEVAAEKAELIGVYYHDVEKEAMRRSILDEGKRLDGRKTTEIRDIWSEVDYLPGAHGSAVFTRGETQSLTTVTLGTNRDEKLVDEALVSGKERFLLHYNFPPFSTGDARMSRGTGRREIGHGNLAFRALKPMLPDDCPYVVRIVSEILESNGSSSMATVCAGTLALMDAGVQIKKPVSGIAMGLISENEGKNFAVLSDILGDEDHLGDMDFKVTGTRDGITATQMDIKVDGLSYEILETALRQAKAGRMHILDKIQETLAGPNEDLKPHAPRIVVMMIPKEFIGAIIGPGGKIIQGIQAETGATISVEETEDQGRVEIAATNKESLDGAINRVKGIVAIPEVGATYPSKVKSIMAYGAFVEFMPGKEGLLHISEIDWQRIESMEAAGIKEGDSIDVK